MKKICCFLPALAVLFSCSKSVDKATLRSEIEKANRSFMDAVVAKDAQAVAALYAEDAFIMPPNSPAIQGRDAAKSFFQATIQSGVRKLEMTTLDVEGDGTSAVERGAYTVMIDGDVVVDKGKYLVHWRNVDGEWKLNQDMFSSDLPASQGLKPGNVLGVHVRSVKLNRGVTYEQLMDFYKKTVVPAFEKSCPEAKLYVVRGLRGEGKNSAGLVYFFDSDDGRNKYFKEDGSPTENGEAMFAKMTPVLEEMQAKYGTESTKYTDWVVE